MSKLREQFIEFSVNAGVLRFGEFKTKAGRASPYFFNAGLFNDGENPDIVADYRNFLDSVFPEGVSKAIAKGVPYALGVDTSKESDALSKDLKIEQKRHHGYHDTEIEYREKESKKNYDRILQSFRGKTEILSPRR